MIRKPAAVLFVLSLAVLALALVPATGLAAKGGNGGGGHKPGGGGGSTPTGSFTLRLVNDANGNGLVNYADTVTFDVSTSASYPYVTVHCYQNGFEVWGQRTGFYVGWAWGQTYNLQGGTWDGRADADCTADLTSWDSSGKLLGTLAPTMSFHVYPAGS